MQVTLTPHAEELLLTVISRHPGQSPAEILEQALAEQVRRESSTPLPLPPPKQLSREEFEAALDAMAEHSEKIPLLPDEAFSRESLYQDHD